MSFAQLYRDLDESNKTNDKLVALVNYFRRASNEDAAWAIFFLTGQRLPRPVPNKILRQWAIEKAKIPEWLFEETYAWVGDLAEALSCVLPPSSSGNSIGLSQWVAELSTLRSLEEEAQRERLDDLFARTMDDDRFPMMKLLTGSMRVGVSQGLVVKALSRHTGLSVDTIAHRLMGDWTPSGETYRKLLDPNNADADLSRPYPFSLAHPVEGEVDALGPVESFLVEWKWDGIRAQLIRRKGTTYLWSRGEERLDGRFPEVEQAASQWGHDCVLDGEILAFKNGLPLPFAELQRRIGRKTIGKKLMQEVPVCFVAFDLLELHGIDYRERTQRDRRLSLETVLKPQVESSGHLSSAIRISKQLNASSWDDLMLLRESSRAEKAEGMMLKKWDSPYPVGRVRGHWWKWKVEPFTIDAVLLYAQRGHGRRAALYTDYTFALWDDGVLVPFAKAYSGLSDQELVEVDRFVRANTREKFGPVRSVTPELVMELAFENIQRSSRHKSGVAVRFPRIVRWRRDKKMEDANQLDDLKRMISS